MCLYNLRVVKSVHLFTCISHTIYACTYNYVVVDPVDTTVCEDDTATFSCVYFLSAGAVIPIEWVRDNGLTVNQRYVTNNVTDNTTTPAYIRSTVTLRKVTLLDNGTMYQCGITTFLSSSSTLIVVGR